MAAPSFIFGTILVVVGLALLTVKAEEQSLSSDKETDALRDDERIQNDKENVSDSTAVVAQNDKRQIIIRPYKEQRCTYHTGSQCCGGYVVDNPKVKTCCRGRIVLKSMAAYLCRRRKSRTCGRLLYDRKIQRCCYRQVIPRQSKCRRRRCGRDRYITYFHQCCHGRVISKSVPCLLAYKCGGVSFDASRQKCCSGRLVPIHYPCTRMRCGYLHPNPLTHQCCNGRVIPGSFLCARSRCGGISFNSLLYKCCQGRLIFIHSPCVPKIPCGRSFLDPHSQKCCNGQAIPRNSPCVLFLCGGFNYNLRTHQCCNGRIFSRFLRCPIINPGAHLCGGNFIDRSRQQCCFGKALAPLTAQCLKCGLSFYVPSGCQCCHDRIFPSFVQCGVPPSFS